MADRRHEAAERIFRQAARRPAEERDSFLETRCAGDVELRSLVEALFRDDLDRTVGYPRGLETRQSISHYEILDRLGEGGMGVVYRARDLRLRREVALKLLPRGIPGSSAQAARFLREARMAAALNHSSICTIYEIGEVEEDTDLVLDGRRLDLQAGTPFIAMELIDGTSLREVLKNTSPLPADHAGRISIEVASGLAAAHSRGIVHRDLKPANVMIASDGRVKIVDFGLARPLASESSLLSEDTPADVTRQGEVVGTIRYMSPEQARGERVDERSDVFSFGTMMYEMLAGRPPFAGRTPTETLAKILEVEPEPLGKSSPNVPAELEVVVARCLRKDPSERFRSGTELESELKRLTVDRIVTGPFGRRAGGRSIAGVGLAALVGLLLFVGIRSSREPLDLASEETVLAVLPFRPTRSPADESVARETTDVVSARLAGFEGLVVASSHATEELAGSSEGSAAIGRQLGAQYLLTGAVQLRSSSDGAPSTVRIMSQLIRVSDDVLTWAGASETDSLRLFEAQLALARRVAWELRLRSADPKREPDLDVKRAGLSLEQAMGVDPASSFESATARVHFDVAIRALVDAGVMAPGTENDADLVNGFERAMQEQGIEYTSDELLASYRAVQERSNGPRDATIEPFELERELELIFAEIGIVDRQIPSELVNRTGAAVDFWTVEYRPFTEKSIARAATYLPMIRQELRRERLPEVFAYLPFVTSGYRPDIRTRPGAVGLWRFMPETARAYGLRVEPPEVDERKDPYKATVAACDFLQSLLSMFGTNAFLCAVGAYSSGEYGMMRCLRGVDWRSDSKFLDIVARDDGCLSQETVDFVPRFLAAAVILRRPEAFGFE